MFQSIPAVLLLLILANPNAVLAQATPDVVSDPALMGPTVSHPFVPLASVRVKAFEGEFTDPETGETTHERVEERVLPETTTVAGIEVTAVEVHEYARDELTEHTLDYYAQHADGTVYYLGEDVDVYEDGELVGHAGGQADQSEATSVN
jgi:hypothetical protein